MHHNWIQTFCLKCFTSFYKSHERCKAISLYYNYCYVHAPNIPNSLWDIIYFYKFYQKSTELAMMRVTNVHLLFCWFHIPYLIFSPVPSEQSRHIPKFLTTQHLILHGLTSKKTSKHILNFSYFYRGQRFSIWLGMRKFQVKKKKEFRKKSWNWYFSSKALLSMKSVLMLTIFCW